MALARGTTAACSPICFAARSTSPRPTSCSSAGHDDLRLLDNGAIGRADGGRSRIDPRLPPGPEGGRARRTRSPPMPAPAATHPSDCIAVGDSVEDLEVAAAVGRFFVVANGPQRDPGLRAGARRLGQRHGHRGRDGRRLLRGGRLDADASAAERAADARRLRIGPSTIGEIGRGARDRRRGGVPADHVLAGGGRAADDRRQHRPRDAALAADRARDDRPPRARTATSTRAATSRSASPSQGASTPSTIVRRHRMIERFLTDVLGIPWDEVHEEAERIEHAMSPVLEERMRAAIGDATTCPHGHPIVEGAREQGALLADVEAGAEVHVLRFENEAEELLHYLKDAGLHPGLEGKLESSGEDEVDRSPPPTAATRSRAASPRRSRSAPTRRRRRGRRSPSSWFSPATATAAEAASRRLETADRRTGAADPAPSRRRYRHRDPSMPPGPAPVCTMTGRRRPFRPRAFTWSSTARSSLRSHNAQVRVALPPREPMAGSRRRACTSGRAPRRQRVDGPVEQRRGEAGAADLEPAQCGPGT